MENYTWSESEVRTFQFSCITFRFPFFTPSMLCWLLLCMFVTISVIAQKFLSQSLLFVEEIECKHMYTHKNMVMAATAADGLWGIRTLTLTRKKHKIKSIFVDFHLFTRQSGVFHFFFAPPLFAMYSGCQWRWDLCVVHNKN